MKVHAIRLTPGTDLKAALEQLTRERAIAAGCVLSCVGSLTRTRLRLSGRGGGADAFLTLNEPVEIMSLTGTLGPDGLHLHMGVAKADGACVGGHLVEGCIVHTTAEIVVCDLAELAFRRAPDPATGYSELVVEPRRAAGDRPSG